MGLLLVGGLRDRDHPEVARVDRVGEPADRAALAGGVPPLEHPHDGATLLACRADDAVEPAKPLVPLLLVRGLRELVVEGQREEAAQPRGPKGDDPAPAAPTGGGEPAAGAHVDAEAREEDVGDCQVARAGVLGIDHVPGRPGLVGRAPHPFRKPGQPVVVPLALPIVGRHPPGRSRVRLELPEAAPLGRLGQVEPDLDDQGPAGRELALEPRESPEHGVKLAELARAAGVLVEGVGVPAAGVDRHAAVRGKGAPIAPHGGPLPLLVRGLVEREGLEPARVEPPVQDVDDLALPGGLDAADDEDHRELGRLELDLHPHERRADVRKTGLIGFLGKAPVISRFRHFAGVGFERSRWHG